MEQTSGNLSGTEEELLQQECEKYGLPVSLDYLLRHIRGNHAATLGATQSSIEILEFRIHKAVQALLEQPEREIRDELLIKLDPHGHFRDPILSPYRERLKERIHGRN